MKFGEFQIGTDSEGEEDELFFIWPTTLIHKINSDSPFYDMSAKDFLKRRYEIVIMLEGVVEQTGNSIQVWAVFFAFLRGISQAS